MPTLEVSPLTNGEVVARAIDIADRVAKTEFVPKPMVNRPEAVLAAILTGHELGVGPMVALANIDVIEGRPAIRSHLMRALLARDGHLMWPEESTATRCVMVGKRAGEGQPIRVTWTTDDARKAGLLQKQNWQRYPRQMLTARATSELARLIAPDSLGGLYTIEELEDSDGTMGTVITEPAAPTTTKRRRRRELTTSVGEPEKSEAEVVTEKQIIEAFAPDEHPNPVPPLPGEEGYEAPTQERVADEGPILPVEDVVPPRYDTRFEDADPSRPFDSDDPAEAWPRLLALLEEPINDAMVLTALESRIRELFRLMDLVKIWNASEDPTRDALHLALRRHASATHLQSLRKAEMVEFGKKCLEAAKEVIAARAGE